MRLPRYPTYKDSGVPGLGDIPAHWTLTRLKYVAIVQTGIAKGKDNGDKETVEVPYLRVANVQDGYLKLEDVATIEISSDALARYRLQPGDVLMNEGGDFDKLGRGHVWEGQIEDCIHQNHVFAVRPFSVDSEWLNKLSGSDYAQFYFMARSKQSTNLASISSTNLMELPMVIPSGDEQRAILQFLKSEMDKIDFLVSEQEKLITLLAEKRHATISHAVTRGLNPNAPMKDSGVEWLGEVPETWKVIQLKHLCTLVKDGTHLPPARVENGIPLMSVRNIIDSEFCTRDDDSFISEDSYKELCRAFAPAVGDVILACVGATLGKSAIIKEGLGAFHIQRSVALFRPISSLSSKWLHFCFLSGGFQRLLWEYVGFSAQPGIYLGTLAQFKIAVPEFNEQKNIVEFIQQETMRLDALVAKATRGIALLKERRSALISAAVTGKIDVRQLVLGESVTIQEAA